MSSTLLASSPVWTAAGWTMLHLLWVGAAIGLMATLVRRLLGSARPETRYGVALTCLLALSVSPALIFVRICEPDSGTRIVTALSLGDRARALPSFTGPDRQESVRPEFRNPPFVRSVGDPAQSRLDSLVTYLPWFWMCGSLWTLVMLATGLVGVEQLRRSSRLVESSDIPQRCRALADSLGIARRVSVGICDRLAMPVLIGIVWPLILLPPAALSGWSIEQLEMVLLHELAHLRRWDNLVNLLQRFVESLLFFHPVVWWLSGWVRLERELCCDRLVVERIGQPVAYAEMLAALSETSGQRRQAVLAMADRQVLTRIRRLLNLEERSMKLTMSEGLGMLGAVIVGVLLVLGSQAAPPQAVSESTKVVRPIPGTAVDDIKDKPVMEARPPSEQVIRNDTSNSTRPRTRAPLRNPRAITLFRRDARRLQIVQLPTTPEGVVTYRCRGGIEVVCKSQKFGTIRMEADEAVIKRVERHGDPEPAAAPNGETWFDEADVPMEVHLKGDVIFRQDEDKTAGNGDQWTVRAPQLDYDFVTGRVVSPTVDHAVVAPGLEILIKDDIRSTARLRATRDLMPVRPIGERTTSLYPRKSRHLQIRRIPETIEGVVTYVCQGGIMIVSDSPRFGTFSIKADEAVIVRNLHRSKGETVAGPNRETWVEEDDVPMEVHLKGDVVLRQERAMIAGKGEQRTVRARELEYDLVADSVLALDAELEVAVPGIETPIRIVSPRILQFHPNVRQPNGSLAPSEQFTIRTGH